MQKVPQNFCLNTVQSHSDGGSAKMVWEIEVILMGKPFLRQPVQGSKSKTLPAATLTAKGKENIMHNLKILAVALLLTSLAIAPAFAKRNGCENFTERGGHGETRFEHIKDRLDLTEQQEKDIRKIIASSKEKAGKLREEKRATREAIREVTRAEALDETRLRELVRRQADQRVDMMVAKHAARSRINQVLTPEQQEEHKAIRNLRHERRGSAKGREKTQ